MKLVLVAVLAFGCIIQAISANEKANKTSESPHNVAVGEVVVNSMLSIRPRKQQQEVRRVREIPLFRQKRQFQPDFPRGFNNFGQFGSRQSVASANSNSHFFGPDGFGNADAGAQSQTFDAKSPLGDFGASANGVQTQTLTVNKDGMFSGGFGGSFNQQYRLANGQVIDVNAANGVTFANGQASKAGSSSVNISKG